MSCSTSLTCVYRAQNAHWHVCRRRASRYVQWTRFSETSCVPLVALSAPSWRQKDRPFSREAPHRGELPSCRTLWFSFHNAKQETSHSKTVPGYSKSPELSTDASYSHTKFWRQYASTDKESFILLRTQCRLPPLLYEPCTRSPSFVRHLRVATRQDANQSTVLSTGISRTLHWLTGGVRIYGLSGASNSREVAHLRLLDSAAAQAAQREMPVLPVARFSLRRGHTWGCVSSITAGVTAAPKICTHYRSVQRPSVLWQGHLSAVLASVYLHGTARKPGQTDTLSCICKHCKGAVPRELDIFCKNCGGVLQPRYDSYKPGGYSFFDLLELKPEFALDPALLDAKHKKLQKELHPDKTLDADEERQIWSEEHRKQIVLAVTTLRCPARRVLHLLQQHFHSLPGGVEKEEMERVTDSDLLIEVLELNEALEGLCTREELNVFEKKIQDILQDDEKALAATFREKDVEGMRKGAQRYMMHAGLLDRIRNWSP